MSPETITQHQIEKYRRMTGEQRLIIALNLHELSCEIARDGIRGRYRNADSAFVEEQLRHRLRMTYATDPNVQVSDD